MPDGLLVLFTALTTLSVLNKKHSLLSVIIQVTYNEHYIHCLSEIPPRERHLINHKAGNVLGLIIITQLSTRLGSPHCEMCLKMLLLYTVSQTDY